MKLFEYQAKACFQSHGIQVPESVLVKRGEEVLGALNTVGFPCVLKAQTLSGGRGKAGLVQKAAMREQAEAIARELFGRAPKMEYLLVERRIDAAAELYVSITMDPAEGKALLMGCRHGGVEIERIAAERPEEIIRELIDPYRGIEPFQRSDFCYRLGLRDAALQEGQRLVAALYRAFVSTDAELAEINPLFLTREGTLIAGDGKLSIDDNAVFRHPQYQREREHYASDMEYEAAQEGIPYIEFGGDISLMAAGAGLANTVYDLIHYEGGTVSNYLEFGGPNYKKAEIALRLCLKNSPKVILIVTFGTVARADVMAEGIADAVRALSPDCPIVPCLRGTGEEKVGALFAPVGLENLTDTEAAVRRAVAIAKGGRAQ